MRLGRIVEHGPTAQVFGDPQHSYTRELMDAAPGKRWIAPDLLLDRDKLLARPTCRGRKGGRPAHKGTWEHNCGIDGYPPQHADRDCVRIDQSC